MIATDKYIIRAVETDDIESVFAMNSQAERGEFQEFAFESKDALSKRLYDGHMFNETFQTLMVESPEKAHIGLIYVNFLRPGLVRLGLVLKPDARHKGLGKDITRTITRYLFDNFDVIRIEADTDANNIAAQRVLESAGFMKEGLLRKYRYHHGCWNDSVLYSIIKQVSP